jgi:hypothetical protein
MGVEQFYIKSWMRKRIKRDNMKTKKTMTVTMDIEIIDELKGIAKNEQLNLSATAQRLWIEWLRNRWEGEFDENLTVRHIKE